MPEDRELARDSTLPAPEILSVSALNRSVRDLIEHRYALLWVGGEISNFTVPKSGHAYFVLKDAQAQVRCVMFRNRNQALDWAPRDGMQVEVRALLTLYEARGEFQLNVETMRRAGRGALFEAFLRLRERLEKEGLFDAARKRPLPAHPRAVGVITSLQAAALRDVLTTLARRNPSLPVVVYPAPVQGERAAEDLAAALETAGRRRECDVLLLVRGGGSIEDLWAFNEEILARAIRACPVPVVTGIGHETDFTIADFAADRRAPTPTAAAELVSPQRAALLAEIGRLLARLGLQTARDLERRMQLVDHLARGVVHPAARLQSQSQLLGQLRLRLRQAALRVVPERGPRLEDLVQRLHGQALARLEGAATRCASLVAGLAHLDPTAVLARGYSIVEKAGGVIVRDSAALVAGETVAIRFARGRARARIDAKD